MRMPHRMYDHRDAEIPPAPNCRERERQRSRRREEWQRRTSPSPPPTRIPLRSGTDLLSQHPPRRSHHCPPFDADGRRDDYVLSPDTRPDKRFTLKTRKGKDLRYYVSRNGAQPPSPSRGGDLRGKDIFVPPKSMYLDEDGPATGTYFPLSMENVTYDAAPPNLRSTSVGGATGAVPTSPGAGIYGDEDIRYLDPVRERHDERQKHKLYGKERHITFYGSPQRILGAVTAEDDFLHPYQDTPFHPSPKRFGRGSRPSNFMGGPSGFDQYSRRPIFNAMEQRPVSPLVCDESDDYVYSDYCGRTERPDHGPPPTMTDAYMQKPGRTQEDYPVMFDETFVDPYEERVEELEASPNTLRNSNFYGHDIFLKRRPISDFDIMQDTQEEYSPITESIEWSRPPLEHEFADTGGNFEFLRNGCPEYHSERSVISHLSNRYIEAYTEDVSPMHRGDDEEDVDIYDPDPSYDRMWSRGQYAINEDRVDSRRSFPSTRKRHAMVEPSRGKEPWTSEARMHLASLKKIGFGRLQSKSSTCRFQGSDSCFSSHASEGGRNINLNKRLKPGPSDLHGSFQFNKKQDFYNSYKFCNKSTDNQKGFGIAHGGDVMQDGLHLGSDVVEGSEEFKQLVHKFFLRFSKFLNENSHQQKKFRENGKAGGLKCCVCGSLSKEFTDTHSLVMHTFNCLKTKFRADHLGLHKALCVLMGWNWGVAPDNGKLYQYCSAEDVKALKEDLIIWPPLIIVHNSSICNKNIATGQRIIDNEGMAAILRDVGFAAGKARVFRGKPTDQSVLLVKFFPTFSGLQEAEKLHKYYVDAKRGRKEFEAISSSSGVAYQKTESQVEKLLYGYMATSEDMDNLDSETKKRCVIKSKKEIEAIADASLTSSCA